MKKKFIAVLLLISILVLPNFSIEITADTGILLPAAVKTVSGEKWGYVNESGKFIINPIYSFAQEFNNKGIAIVANNTNNKDTLNISFINRSGKVVSGPISSVEIPNYNNGFAILTSQGKGSTAVNENGNVVLKSKYPLFDYSEGLIKFSNKELYGFMDLNGKVVVPSKYLSVESFKDGKAAVQESSGNFSIINKEGNILEKLKYYTEFYSSEGISAYRDPKSEKWGFKLNDGTIAIEPKFNSSSTFEDGYCIVSVESSEFYAKYALIDKKGNYVIKPEYSGISYLGNGLYSVSKASKYYTDQGLPKAIFNNKGEKLTDFNYYSVSKFDGDYAAASDNTTTFFIDTKGNVVDNLPKLQGMGQMKLIGDIVKAELDDGLVYTKKNGNIIWAKNENLSLGNGIKVKTQKYRKDLLTLVKYPEFSGLKDNKVQTSINQQLKKSFIANYDKSNIKEQTDESDYLESVTIDFIASFNKNLLIIEKSGYIYPLGAAHGMPSLDYIYIDMKTGKFYQLADLFKSKSNYTNTLSSIVNKQITLNTKIDSTYLVNKATVSKNQYFIIGKDSIKIYYYPYEVACYAAGFPEFEIPYGQLTSIIDTKGAFWNSFDKTLASHKIRNISGINETKIKSIAAVMDSYEKNLITAINSNNFAKVEGSLLNNSTLYSSQKKLVNTLYKQKTKEKLNNYELYAVEYNSNNAQYKVYVQEQIAVKASGKNYVNKAYNWCYIVKDDKNGNFKLSAISKW